MKATLISVAVLAVSATAQTTSACGAQSIVDACLETTQSYLSQCGTQDFACLCEKYTTIMTCFNNCPNDDRRYATDSQRQLYCANASAFPSTTTTTANTATQTGATESSPANPAATTTFGNSGNGADATSSGGANPSSTTEADAAVAGHPGAMGLMAAFAGVAAAALL
ncbi:putative GPI anchored serine-threonine rich protein [Rosellinia necatrix]|uniref:Putative GPI anchored serine-threonine rich protein n=1 Tax=Rosellinia necatrix TaxID=77044 RepID=A0A1S7UMD5_ROSNE|nr:putative GPI anchored serine-threonine rich protein [Rosellinia necatrix]